MQHSSPYSLYKQAFQVFYQPLCQYAHALVKDVNDSEDIVQEIFLHIWEKKKDLIGREELRFYLFTAVRNRCFSHLKKSRRIITGDLAGLEEPEQAGRYGSEEAVDLNGLVGTALNRLPLKCREAFVLSRISKLTYQQIAQATGVSIKTVENQIGKALKIMRSFVREKQFQAIILLIYIYLCS